MSLFIIHWGPHQLDHHHLSRYGLIRQLKSRLPPEISQVGVSTKSPYNPILGGGKLVISLLFGFFRAMFM